MADEINITIRATIVNAELNSQFTPGTVTLDQASQGLHAPVVSVGTSEEDFSPGDIAAADQGFLAIKNLDTTNFVKYGPKSGGAMIEFGRIKAGEVAIFRLAPSVVLRWIADTAAVNVQCWLLKN